MCAEDPEADRSGATSSQPDARRHAKHTTNWCWGSDFSRRVPARGGHCSIDGSIGGVWNTLVPERYLGSVVFSHQPPSQLINDVIFTAGSASGPTLAAILVHNPRPQRKCQVCRRADLPFSRVPQARYGNGISS